MNSAVSLLSQNKQNSYCAKTSINKDYLVAVLFLLFFFVCKIVSNELLFYVASFCLALFMLLCKPKSLLIIMIILLPSSGLIKLSDYGAAILGYCFLIGEIKYLLLYPKKIKTPYFLIILTVCVLVTVFIYFDISLAITLFRFFISVLFLYMISKDETIVLQLKRKGVEAFIFGTIVNVILGISFYLIKSQSMFNGDFYGVSLDRNFYSAVISMAISFAVVLFLDTKKPTLIVVEIVFLLFGGLLSGSRTFFVSLLIPIVVMIFSLFSSKHFKRIMPLLAFALIILLVGWNVIWPLLSKTVDRFSEQDALSGNGRFEIWRFYLDSMKESPLTFLFGCSSKMTRYISNNHTAHDVVQHNTFIQSLSTIGVLGTVFLVLSFSKFFSALKQNGKKDLKYLSPLLSLLVCYFFINGLFSDLLTIMIYLSICFFYKSAKQRFHA